MINCYKVRIMKDSTMSRKRDKDSQRHSDYSSKDSSNDTYDYKHVLKERHYRDGMDDEKNRKREKDRSNDSQYSHHHKRKRSRSPHRRSHHGSPSLKSKTESDDSNHYRSRKHHEESDVTESYEELSRRKRKLESELLALDLEEAAEREAENKKTRREKSDHRRDKEIPHVKIKQEKSSDDERKPKIRSPVDVKVKIEKDRGQASKKSEDKSWGKSQQEARNTDKEKPNLAVSGKLAEETNTYNGIVIKYNEPSEARKPKRRWRLYPFKGDSNLPFIPIHRQSAYLFGRTRLIADIPIDHPSCSKQHAVLQYRLVPYKRDDGTTGRRVRPYIIDLESSNGTFINNQKIDARHYVELQEKDVIKFGFSSREYVLLHEESKNNEEEEDDDVQELSD